MEILIGSIVIVMICLGIIYLIADRMFKQLIYSPGQPGWFLFQREAIEGRYSLADFNRWHKESFFIESEYGYHIHATHIHATKPSNRFVVLCHGFSCQELTSYKYVQLFLDAGFHVITYDQRFHGLSGGEFLTYGYYEKDDLKALIHWIYQQFGADTIVGIHGESMGASTALLYAGAADNQAAFYIADCPFSDFDTIISERYKHNYPRLPRFPFLPISRYLWRKRLGFGWDVVSPVNFMKEINKPVLLIHTKNDRFTSLAHAIRLHDANPEGTQLIIMPEGGHAQALIKNRESYTQTIHQFLSEHL